MYATNDEIEETFRIIRHDVDIAKSEHALVDGRCLLCGSWPCRAFACATWLERIVLERAGK